MEASRSLPESRRHQGGGHFARGLCLGALILASLGPAAAPAGAATGPGVQVVGPGIGGFLGPTELKEGAVEGTCGLRGTPGEAPQQNGCRGLPVAVALSRMGVDSFGYLTLPRPNGTTAYLPSTYFREPTLFEGDMPPIFFVDSAATRFYRPAKADDPDDVNAEDNIATVSGEALVVGVHDGSVVEVQVTPSTTSASAGSPVEFKATVPARSGFEFTWTFGDGTTGSGEAVSHAFSGSGTYEVRATAVGQDESGGESAPVSIVVGNPPTTEAPGATPTPTPRAKQPKGAPGKGSKPTVTGGRGKKKPSQTSAPQHGGSPEGRSGAAHQTRETSESSAPAPSTPRLEIPTTLPPPTALPPMSEERSGGALPEQQRGGSGKAPPERSPQPSTSQSQDELVEGRLVGDDLGPTTIEEALDGTAEGEGSPSAAGAVGSGGTGVPVVALIVVALLGGGALFEWRRSRPIR